MIISEKICEFTDFVPIISEYSPDFDAFKVNEVVHVNLLITSLNANTCTNNIDIVLTECIKYWHGFILTYENLCVLNHVYPEYRC